MNQKSNQMAPPPVDSDPLRRRGLAIVLQGFERGPRRVPYLVVDLGLRDGKRADDALADLFGRGLAPVRSYDDQVYPAKLDWTYGYHYDPGPRQWQFSLAHRGWPAIAVAMRCSPQWADLERSLSLAVVAIGNAHFADVDVGKPESHPGERLVPQLGGRLAAGHLVGATLRGRLMTSPIPSASRRRQRK